MRRAMISVLSNFAEGFERNGRREFIRHLSFSKGSISELRAQLIYCFDQGYIEQDIFESIDTMGEHCGRLIGGLMSHLAKKLK